jgi:hypothetical protein
MGMTDAEETPVEQPVKERRKPGPKPKAPVFPEAAVALAPRHRLTRAEEIAAGRRRRNPSESMSGLSLQLGVDPETKDPNYEYRWINDDKGRLESLTQRDDWDFVENDNVAADNRNLNESESRIRRRVGINQAGEPLYAYWCRKYKPWYDEDQRKLADAASAKRQTLIQTQDSVGEDPAHTYVPKEAQIAAAQTMAAEQRRIRRSQKG